MKLFETMEDWKQNIFHLFADEFSPITKNLQPSSRERRKNHDGKLSFFILSLNSRKICFIKRMEKEVVKKQKEENGFHNFLFSLNFH